MREEIFGPVLPIKTYSWLDEAIDYVNRRPRPLALYYFGTDATKRDEVLRKTISGGAAVNTTLFHIAAEGLPFGGIGASGIGAYHGEFGSAAEPPQCFTLPASAVRPHRRPDAEIPQPLTLLSRRRSKFHQDRRLVSPARPRESGDPAHLSRRRRVQHGFPHARE
jgi:hypothetical protein